jgi:hypothetical protein
MTYIRLGSRVRLPRDAADQVALTGGGDLNLKCGPGFTVLA